MEGEESVGFFAALNYFHRSNCSGAEQTEGYVKYVLQFEKWERDVEARRIAVRAKAQQERERQEAAQNEQKQRQDESGEFSTIHSFHSFSSLQPPLPATPNSRNRIFRCTCERWRSRSASGRIEIPRRTP